MSARAGLTSADGRGWKRPFEGRVLRMFGKYSYCLYVVHYPLMMVLDMVAAKYRIMALTSAALWAWVVYGVVLIGCSLAIAWISWRVLEAPMLALKDVRFVRRPRMTPA